MLRTTEPGFTARTAAKKIRPDPLRKAFLSVFNDHLGSGNLLLWDHLFSSLTPVPPSTLKDMLAKAYACLEEEYKERGNEKRKLSLRNVWLRKNIHALNQVITTANTQIEREGEKLSLFEIPAYATFADNVKNPIPKSR